MCYSITTFENISMVLGTYYNIQVMNDCWFGYTYSKVLFGIIKKYPNILERFNITFLNQVSKIYKIYVITNELYDADYLPSVEREYSSSQNTPISDTITSQEKPTSNIITTGTIIYTNGQFRYVKKVKIETETIKIPTNDKQIKLYEKGKFNKEITKQESLYSFSIQKILYRPDLLKNDLTIKIKKDEGTPDVEPSVEDPLSIITDGLIITNNDRFVAYYYTPVIEKFQQINDFINEHQGHTEEIIKYINNILSVRSTTKMVHNIPKLDIIPILSANFKINLSIIGNSRVNKNIIIMSILTGEHGNIVLYKPLLTEMIIDGKWVYLIQEEVDAITSYFDSFFI